MFFLVLGIPEKILRSDIFRFCDTSHSQPKAQQCETQVWTILNVFEPMKVFGWFTSKTTKKVNESTKHGRRLVDMATSTPPSSPSTQDVSKVAKLFNETVLQKTNSLKKAQLQFEEHDKARASLKRKLDEVECRKKEAEFDLQAEKDIKNNISSKKIRNEEERHEISEAQNANCDKLKIKQNSLDKFNDELNRVYNDLKEAEMKKETLQKQIDEEQKDHDMLTSAMTVKRLDFNAEAVDASVEAVVEAEVEAAVAVDSINSPMDNEKNALAIGPVQNKDIVAIEYGFSVQKTSHGFPTEVKVTSQDGDETIYKRGELVKVKWDCRSDNGNEMHVDGVSFTEMMNNACFGMIETIETTDGKLKFGLRFFYHSHFTIEGDPRFTFLEENFVMPVQKFLYISDRIWNAKRIDTAEIFRSREDVEYHEINSIEGKHEIEEPSFIRWEYGLLDGKTKNGKLYTPKYAGNFTLPNCVMKVTKST